MQIAPPYGYREVVPLLRNHRVRLAAAGEVPAFARQSNAMPVSLTEMQLAMRDYPLVFTSGDQGKSFAVVAVLGMVGAENLYLEGDRWASGVYVPAYVRRHPFCMALVQVQGAVQKDRLICVEKEALDEAGEALFDEQGKATPAWAERDRLLTEFEADLERSREMCATLAEFGLLEPFTMQATLEGGPGPMNLTGMYRVSEKNLEALNAGQLRTLVRKGYFARIYLHLVSLDNFHRLLERKRASLAKA